jgi:hypothetical protein
MKLCGTSNLSKKNLNDPPDGNDHAVGILPICDIECLVDLACQEGKEHL